MDLATSGTGSERSEPGEKLGHHPIIGYRVGEVPTVPERWIVDALVAASVPDISDAVGRLYTMSHDMHPLYSGMPKLAGTAVTVKAPPGDNWAIHGGLGLCGPGHVLVVDWQGYREGAGAGVDALVPAISRGLAGVVIDGSWRDVSEIQVLEMPIVGRGISPFSPAKAELGEINVPISCGGVVVEPGDFVVGDCDGTVVVPRRWVNRVAEAIKPFVRRASLTDYPEELQASVQALGRAYHQAADGWTHS